MATETVDGTRTTHLYTDEGGRQWHIMQRGDGSICLYWTSAGIGWNHMVHFDTLDGTAITPRGWDAVLVAREMRAAIDALLAVIDRA